MRLSAKTGAVLFMLLLYPGYLSAPLEAADDLEDFESWAVEEIGDYTDIGEPEEPLIFRNSMRDAYERIDSYDRFEKTIHGKKVGVAISKQYELSDLAKEKLSKWAWLSWARAWAEFQGFIASDYLGIIKPGEWSEGSNNFFVHALNPKPVKACIVCTQNRESISHEVFHAWDGGGGIIVNGRWFVEGITTYYASRFLPSKKEYSDTMHIFKRAYENDQIDYPLADERSSVYFKGAMVGYMLDKPS